MMLILGLVIGGLVGMFCAAIMGANKIHDLEMDNSYYRDLCLELRVKMQSGVANGRKWDDIDGRWVD